MQLVVLLADSVRTGIQGKEVFMQQNMLGHNQTASGEQHWSVQVRAR